MKNKIKCWGIKLKEKITKRIKKLKEWGPKLNKKTDEIKYWGINWKKKKLRKERKKSRIKTGKKMK